MLGKLAACAAGRTHMVQVGNDVAAVVSTVATYANEKKIVGGSDEDPNDGALVPRPLHSPSYKPCRR